MMHCNSWSTNDPDKWKWFEILIVYAFKIAFDMALIKCSNCGSLSKNVLAVTCSLYAADTFYFKLFKWENLLSSV